MNLEKWIIPEGRTITVALVDQDNAPVNFADCTVLHIEAMINKEPVKLFALEGDEYAENQPGAVEGEGNGDKITLEFTTAETESWKNGVFELNVFSEHFISEEETATTHRLIQLYDTAAAHFA